MEAPVRIVHTSDWHLGHTLHEVDRAPEHEAFVAWLLDTLADEAADALLIAGDIFDSANPSGAAMRLWHRFLVQAWQRVPALHVVAIAGNHDAAARLDASVPLLDALGRLHVVGGADDARMVASLPGAQVIAVPFLRPMDLEPGRELVDAVRAVCDRVTALARAVRTPEQALVAMAHCYMASAALSEGSERKIQMGNQQALPLDLFATDIAYVALGHLHLPQRVGGLDHVRYAGSPLPLALDERRYPHAVTVVDLDGSQLIGQRQVRVPRWRELVRIPDSGAAALADAVAALQAFPAVAEAEDDPARWPLVEVVLAADHGDPLLRPAIQAAAADRALRLLRIGVQARAQGPRLADALAQEESAVRGLDELQPIEVMERMWAADRRGEPSLGIRAAMSRLIELAQDAGAAEAARAQRLERGTP